MINPKLYIALVLLFLIGCSAGYENDGNAVYYKYWNEGSGSHKYKIDADPNTFEILKNDRYAKDKQTVFYDGDIIKNADAPTFETLDEWHAKDKNIGYRGKYPVRSSKGINFKVISDYYSTDGNDIFYDTVPMHVCSTKKFKTIDDENSPYEWSTDGCSYFFQSFKVPSDDYAHMRIFKGSGGLSKDRKFVYFMDHKLNYDSDGKKIVDTIDASSFVVTGFLECRDKWGCFNPFHGRENCGKK